jgi:hypothetical protein
MTLDSGNSWPVSDDGLWMWDGTRWLPRHDSRSVAPGEGEQPAKAGTNRLAIASLVFGILAIFGAGSALAVVFGVVAIRQIRRTRQGGLGLAIAGTTLGGVGLAALLVVVTVYTLGGAVKNSFDETCQELGTSGVDCAGG